MARARTGSGKTGSFLIPLIHKIIEQKMNAPKQETTALILAPSKELCKQIVEHIQNLTSLCQRDVRCIDVSPQVPLDAQKPLLADNPDIVVGTPLKILTHINEGNLKFMETLQYLIIDEADLMFAYEHEQDMKAVLKKLPSICQSFITSATMPDDVKQLKTSVLHNPVVLKLEEPPLPPTSQLTHYVIKVQDFDKAVLLYALLRMSLLKGKTLIFVNTVDKGYKLRMFLGQFGIKACMLNSELPVNSRCHIVDQFNRGRYEILIAADEAATTANPPEVKAENTNKRKRKRDRESGVARGIDFQMVANVVNFDFPSTATAYIHRVGRTARANLSGTALSLVCTFEMDTFSQVRETLKELMPSSDCVFKDYKFNMASLDGFRYRASDAWKQCTSIAVKDLRKRELKMEILHSQRLKTFFEEHPRDLEILKYDVGGRCLSTQPHLKNVPEYNIPSALKRVAVIKKKRRANPEQHLRGTSKAKYL
ncbi:UNVERIFIED_CONTAM: hypothetical protein GTU68_028278, partial [Idotea baltica]|nr:hypothetical protein [Idotea baltica]